MENDWYVIWVQDIRDIRNVMDTLVNNISHVRVLHKQVMSVTV